MHTKNLIRVLALAMVLAGVANAGPAISCHWVAVPGSVFGVIGSLRDRAMEADDSKAAGERARAQLVQLRAAIKPGDSLSLLRAGFWATTMHDIGITPDTDGPALILQAVALRPEDAEYQLFAALAHLQSDKATFRKHWELARKLAKPGSTADTNIKVVAKLYANLIDEPHA
jgi:hypothetical protein